MSAQAHEEVPVSANRQLEQNRRLLRKSLIVCGLAFGFCFAMIPIYSIYCEITGANGKTGRMSASTISAVDRSRKVEVEFLASVRSGLNWKFVPELSKMDVYPGEIAIAYFDATNTTDEPIIGNAVPSVAPNEASIYFNKTECFCFTEQLLMPGETRRMPVRFIVDSAMPKDIEVLTLAYSFYRNDKATSDFQQGKRGPAPGKAASAPAQL
jgi:cytochrome c oxidase assembly protein subunit 11